jgi:hypothetical protein
LEERDGARTDVAREVGRDAEQRVDVAIDPYTFTIVSQPRQTWIPAAPYVVRAPKVKPNSEIFGGTSAPAATAPRLTVACTSASTSSEREAVDELVLSRFAVPENLTGCRFWDIVLLNVVAFCSAAGSPKEKNHVSRPRVGVWGIGILTLERVFDEVAASVDVVRRAVQPASRVPATPVHRCRRSRGECAVASHDVQALDGKVHAPVPAPCRVSNSSHLMKLEFLALTMMAWRPQSSCRVPKSGPARRSRAQSWRGSRSCWWSSALLRAQRASDRTARGGKLSVSTEDADGRVRERTLSGSRTMVSTAPPWKR